MLFNLKVLLSYTNFNCVEKELLTSNLSFLFFFYKKKQISQGSDTRQFKSERKAKCWQKGNERKGREIAEEQRQGLDGLPLSQ